jgi:NAD(P)-dependent dehydrogenase (short-subunit alcohol dehydrogenase family)
VLGDITEEPRTAVAAATPTGELAGPEHQGRMVVYLLGSGSDRLTGQVIPIDGGWTAQ